MESVVKIIVAICLVVVALTLSAGKYEDRLGFRLKDAADWKAVHHHKEPKINYYITEFIRKAEEIDSWSVLDF